MFNKTLFVYLIFNILSKLILLKASKNNHLRLLCPASDINSKARGNSVMKSIHNYDFQANVKQLIGFLSTLYEELRELNTLFNGDFQTKIVQSKDWKGGEFPRSLASDKKNLLLYIIR